MAGSDVGQLEKALGEMAKDMSTLVSTLAGMQSFGKGKGSGKDNSPEGKGKSKKGGRGKDSDLLAGKRRMELQRRMEW